MSTNKLIREVKRGATKLGAKVTESKNLAGHIRLVIHHEDGRDQKLVMASSPRVYEATLANTLAWIKRFKEGRT